MDYVAAAVMVWLVVSPVVALIVGPAIHYGSGDQ